MVFVIDLAQNLARDLMNTPANLMTPTIFSLKAAELLAKMPNVTVKIHDKSWAEKQSMNAFLSVARGSSEPLQFLEIIYQGSNPLEKPVALVGKGVTFDSGGISIKPSAGMSLMKADMGGAAVVLAALRAIVLKSLPINVVVGIPLTENMPSGSATKPGDVVVARNGVSIEIDNTDAEGRLILADAINYIGETHNPQAVVELSTLTGAMDVALGPGFAGVFTKSDKLWNELNEAGLKAGDPFWRMPMDDVYESLIKSQVADLKNAGPRSAGACTAAIFLQNFAYPNIPYAHIDIAGVMEEKKGVLAGLTGRPVRSIIEYVESLCK